MRRYRQKKSLVHSHRMLKHRSVAYTMEQPSISGLSIIIQYNNVVRYVYGVDTQASASKSSHVILEILTFQIRVYRARGGWTRSRELNRLRAPPMSELVSLLLILKPEYSSLAPPTNHTRMRTREKIRLACETSKRYITGETAINVIRCQRYIKQIESRSQITIVIKMM